jgi:glycosyltransferase involved in cell wall biosynthesis
MRQKKIGIVFLDDHLAFSPTTLNLQRVLAQEFITNIITFPSVNFNDLNYQFVVCLRSNNFLFRVFNFLLHYFFQVNSYTRRLFLWRKMLLFIHIVLNRYHHLVVVDLKALWYMKGIRKKNVHLLSLELTDDKCLFYKDKVDISNVKSILIQSMERLSFLAGDSYKGNVFIVPNSPLHNTEVTIPERNKNDLLFVGSTYKHFGIYRCLDFLSAYGNYTLTIQGNITGDLTELLKTKYKKIVDEGRVVINSAYFEKTEDLVSFANRFRIGICFYDALYEEVNCFNFTSAPSGKMFTYFAAGVPVIGSGQPGLSIISSYRAGIQIDNLDTSFIKAAIDKIEENYSDYTQNCRLASADFDFQKSVKKFAAIL